MNRKSELQRAIDYLEERNDILTLILNSTKDRNGNLTDDGKAVVAMLHKSGYDKLEIANICGVSVEQLRFCDQIG